jgi:hypothetical protein
LGGLGRSRAPHSGGGPRTDDLQADVVTPARSSRPRTRHATREQGRLEDLLQRPQVQRPGPLPNMMEGQSRHRWCAHQTQASRFGALARRPSLARAREPALHGRRALHDDCREHRAAAKANSEVVSGFCRTAP